MDEGITGECTLDEDMMGEDTMGDGGMTMADGGMTGKDTTTGKNRSGQDMERVGTGAMENIGACVQV
jgi:hypothetical protein